MYLWYTTLAVTAHLAHTARHRAKNLDQANQGLEEQFAERKRAEEELTVLNATLEQRVAERTKAAEARAQELAEANSALERFNRFAVGRERRMIELKQKVNALLREAGRPPAYDLPFLDQEAPRATS